MRRLLRKRLKLKRPLRKRLKLKNLLVMTKMPFKIQLIMSNLTLTISYTIPLEKPKTSVQAQSTQFPAFSEATLKMIMSAKTLWMIVNLCLTVKRNALLAEVKLKMVNH